jgi:hypothetical protein
MRRGLEREKCETASSQSDSAHLKSVDLKPFQEAGVVRELAKLGTAPQSRLDCKKSS